MIDSVNSSNILNNNTFNIGMNSSNINNNPSNINFSDGSTQNNQVIQVFNFNI